jgi:hypothetical protein
MALESTVDRTLHTKIPAALGFVALRAVGTTIRKIVYIQALHAPQRMALGVAGMISPRMEAMKPSVTRVLILLASAAGTVLVVVTDAA